MMGPELVHIQSRELNNLWGSYQYSIKDWNRNVIYIVYRIKKYVQDYKANCYYKGIYLAS